MNRRAFVSAAGAAALAPTLRWIPARRLQQVGIQLYTVRDAFSKDPEGTLSRVAEIGFTEVEFAGYPDGTPQQLRAILDRLRLRAPSAHIGLQQLRTGWEATLDQAAVIGHEYLVVPSLPQSQRQTIDDWKRIAALFNQAGEKSRQRGIRFAYHNHAFEFTPLGGAIPYDVLLQETDPRFVELELDLYWITRGGKDPLDYIARWPGRFPLVHVKDMDATPQRLFADVGTGIIDFRRIFARAQQAGIKHYFYEQDETPGDPFESARVSYRYLRALPD